MKMMKMMMWLVNTTVMLHQSSRDAQDNKTPINAIKNTCEDTNQQLIIN